MQKQIQIVKITSKSRLSRPHTWGTAPKQNRALKIVIDCHQCSAIISNLLQWQVSLPWLRTPADRQLCTTEWPATSSRRFVACQYRQELHCWLRLRPTLLIQQPKPWRRSPQLHWLFDPELYAAARAPMQWKLLVNHKQNRNPLSTSNLSRSRALGANSLDPIAIPRTSTSRAAWMLCPDNAHKYSLPEFNYFRISTLPSPDDLNLTLPPAPTSHTPPIAYCTTSLGFHRLPQKEMWKQHHEPHASADSHTIPVAVVHLRKFWLESLPGFFPRETKLVMTSWSAWPQGTQARAGTEEGVGRKTADGDRSGD